MTWTDEKTELLKKLWPTGKLSASEIGDELGMSRNSVIGKVHRLGLSARAKTPKGAESSRRRAQNTRPEMRAPRAKVYSPVAFARRAQPPLTADQKEYVMGKGIPLLDLAFDQCHWAINERKGFDDHLFCGAKGYPYCPHHARMSRGSGTPSERRATEAA